MLDNKNCYTIGDCIVVEYGEYKPDKIGFIEGESEHPEMIIVKIHDELHCVHKGRVRRYNEI
jgi:hypothetical protein